MSPYILGRTHTKLLGQINPTIHWLKQILSEVGGSSRVGGSAPKGWPETQVPFIFWPCHPLSRRPYPHGEGWLFTWMFYVTGSGGKGSEGNQFPSSSLCHSGKFLFLPRTLEPQVVSHS